MLSDGEDLTVSIRSNPEGELVMLGNRMAFAVTAGDADPLLGQTPASVAQAAAAQLSQIVSETRESRNMHSILLSCLFTLAATACYLFLLWIMKKVRVWVTGLLMRQAEQHVRKLRIGDTQILDIQHLLPALGHLLVALHWLLMALLTYEWLSFVFRQFPYTRPWGESLNDYLTGILTEVFGSIVSAVPGLGIALVIFLLARLCTKLMGQVFERMANADQPISWLNQETMPTTRRLFSIAIWLFAIAMAYPYLPGSQSEAFKGLSVLLGIMVSLGSSSLVGQGAAGLILTYTRTLRIGEYVRIGEHEGTVVAMGMFTTRIRTGLGEELCLPNSVIASTVTKNYSRTVKGAGYIIDTTVTIGYDTPWRQVEAMLLEAAKMTPGILESPPPVVFQTALSDFYPEYRLVAQAIPAQPRPRAEILTMLHANIQDVFNRYDVQIMSPHYMDDTATAKVVKPENWYLKPAAKEKSDSHA
ncbi:mechanosensitive ion channel family protein [Crenobacter sp. HX-7-9]|uniref:Small-conductance mechanosensitive channel n=2 Tax=Crenobacter caeni TaxID=2705474 RepID=A0A6B2KU71_9NEIS|nr:mechanosensitive ion channel family protein [Crenobacter caeni]